MKSEAARPIDAKKHLWYMYGGKKPATFKDKAGNSITIKKGDLFGVQNLNDRIDRVVIPSRPDLRFLLAVESVSAIIDLSKRHRGEVAFAEIKKPVRPNKIKVTLKEGKAEKIDRLAAIKRAAQKPAKTTRLPNIPEVKSPVKVKKRRGFDLDEDTFSDDGNFDFDTF